MFLSSTLLHAPDLIFTQPDVRGTIFTAPFYRWKVTQERVTIFPVPHRYKETEAGFEPRHLAPEPMFLTIRYMALFHAPSLRLFLINPEKDCIHDKNTPQE